MQLVSLHLGLCNVAGAFFKCMPVTGGFSRSAVNYQAGAKSTFASVVTALSLIVTVLFLTPMFRDLPKPILAAIIIVAVSTLVDFGGTVTRTLHPLRTTTVPHTSCIQLTHS
jgi:MFS superfamily sulfate permease-like transporter